jgi:hypothetical protein
MYKPSKKQKPTINVVRELPFNILKAYVRNHAVVLITDKGVLYRGHLEDYFIDLQMEEEVLDVFIFDQCVTNFQTVTFKHKNKLSKIDHKNIKPVVIESEYDIVSFFENYLMTVAHVGEDLFKLVDNKLVKFDFGKKVKSLIPFSGDFIIHAEDGLYTNSVFLTNRYLGRIQKIFSNENIISVWEGYCNIFIQCEDGLYAIGDNKYGQLSEIGNDREVIKVRFADF